MEKIDLKAVMVILKSGDWIEGLKCFTANLAKNTGGEILELKKCRIARRKLMEASGAETTGVTDITRDARHNFNFTLNMELENGQIRKIHPILIFNINGQQVI